MGSGRTISVKKITQLLGGDRIYIKKRPGEPDCTYADISNIKKKLGWRPKINIEKGIKILLKNIKYWENAPIWTPEKIKIATKAWFKFLK